MKLLFSLMAASMLAQTPMSHAAKDDNLHFEDEQYWGRFALENADSFAVPTKSPVAAPPTTAPATPTDAPVDPPTGPPTLAPTPRPAPTFAPTVNIGCTIDVCGTMQSNESAGKQSSMKTHSLCFCILFFFSRVDRN